MRIAAEYASVAGRFSSPLLPDEEHQSADRWLTAGYPSAAVAADQGSARARDRRYPAARSAGRPMLLRPRLLTITSKPGDRVSPQLLLHRDIIVQCTVERRAVLLRHSVKVRDRLEGIVSRL